MLLLSPEDSEVVVSDDDDDVDSVVVEIGSVVLLEDAKDELELLELSVTVVSAAELLDDDVEAAGAVYVTVS